MGKTLDFVVNLSLATSGNFNAQVGPAAENMRRLSQQVQNLQKVSGNISGFQKQTQKLEALRQKLTAAQAKVKDMQATQKRGGLIDAKAFTRANQEAARLQKLIQENTKTLGTFRTELKAAGVDTGDLAKAQANLQTQTERAKAAQDNLNAAQRRFKDIQGRLSWGNIQADVMKSAAFMKAFQKPIQVSMNFEQAMMQVRAVKTMTDEEFSRMEKQAKELGASTQFSATQAANTQENLARAGMSVQDITAAMPAVLNMAGAEGMDLAQAGSIIAKGLGGMGLEGKYAGRLADILAYTSASSNTNIAEIGEAFKVAAPVLSQQGATMEQIASYIGVMANKGYTGSEAGNAIASSTMRLSSLPKKARDMLLGIGLDSRMFRTQTGGMVELPEIMKMIDAAMTRKKLGENQRLEIIKEVFGQNQGKAMSAFLAASVAGAADTMENGVTLQSFGKAAEMNKTRNDTLKGDLTALSSAWEGLMIKIGEALTPINRFFTQTLTEAISRLTNFMNDHRGFFDLVIEACYAFGGIKIASSVISYFRLGIEYLSAWKAMKIAEKGAELATAAAGAGQVAAGMGKAANSAGLFGLSLNSALGIVGMIAFAVYEIYQHWEDIVGAVEKFNERAKEAVNIDRTTPISQLQAGSAEYHIRNMEDAFAIPSLKPHAIGGIFSAPHVGLVAEAGPEAIVPLRDKSRGIPLVLRAAEILGLKPQNTVNENASISALSESGGVINQAGDMMTYTGGTSTSNSASIFSSGGGVINQAREMMNYIGGTSASSSISSFSSEGGIINQAKEMMNYIGGMNSGNIFRAGTSSGNSSMNFTPTYNITVNASGQESEGQSIGENIRAVIEDTMNEIMSRMERLSYA